MTETGTWEDGLVEELERTRTQRDEAIDAVLAWRRTWERHGNSKQERIYLDTEPYEAWDSHEKDES